MIFVLVNSGGQVEMFLEYLWGGELVQLESLCYHLLAVKITAVIIFKINTVSFQNKVSLAFKKVSRKYSSCQLFNGPHLQLRTSISVIMNPPCADMKVNSL